MTASTSLSGNDASPAIAAVSIRGLDVVLGEKIILDSLDLDIMSGEILGLIGASGSGKSVLARTILGLVPKRAGTIRLFGRDLDSSSDDERREIDQRCGVMFQHGALFSSLTISENVQLPMRECLSLSPALLEEMAALKLRLVGLPPDADCKYPSELSGGMTKRAALARALALDPDILFLDEPTSGLDPIAADAFDQLLLALQASLNLTVMMITHDLNSLHAVCDRIAAIAKGRIVAIGTLSDLLQCEDPWVRAYFGGERGQSICDPVRHVPEIVP